MSTLLTIETAHGGMFFSLTYLAAMLVTAGMTIFYGFRKGYPKSSWLLILVTGLLFFIIGEKVASYTSGEWAELLTGFQLPHTEKKTILGGILGLFAGLILAKQFLRFNSPVLDGFAIALPVSMAISRIGCLMAGCCFGIPTDLPWGIHYDASSWVYKVHLEQGLVHLHDQTSLAVHPVQLYQVIGCLIIALIVWRMRKQWKAGGSLFLFSVLSYAALRFLIEFVRDPESSFIMTDVYFGLKVIQWVILAVIISGIWLLTFREAKAKADSGVSLPVRASEMRQGVLMIMLCIVVFQGRKWFTSQEISTILIFLVPVIFVQFFNFYRNHTVTGFRRIFPVLLICCASFMAQKSSTSGKENEKITFTSVGLTGVVGSYYESLERLISVWVPDSGGGCKSSGTDGHWEKQWSPIGSYQRTSYQAGISLSYNKWVGKYYRFTLGARGFLGSESGDFKATSPSGTSFGISPFVGIDWHWVGFSSGLAIGRMKVHQNNPSASPEDYYLGDIISPGYSNWYVLPSVAVRAGPYDILYAEARFPVVFPSTSPVSMFQVGLGSGLGKTNGTKFSAGYCFPGIYAQAVFPIKDKVVLEGLYADNLSSGVNAKSVFSFGISYRFSYKKTNLDSLKHNSDNSLYPFPGFSKQHETVMDIDGNVYQTIALGGQVWMAEDLMTEHYRDGSAIPGVTEIIRGSGQIYNWYTVNDSRKLCPAGWHVPSVNEWRSLISSLGGVDVASGRLEEGFNTEGKISLWWSSTELDTVQAQSLYLNNKTIGIMFAGQAKTTGLNVRCIRDF